MKAFVVDTNVAIVANGGDQTHANICCQLACAERLHDIVERGTVAVDANGAILEEYSAHLAFSGKPGVGDAFFKHVFDNQHQGARVRRTQITPCSDDRRGFKELPENTFDASDRKFLAVAVVAAAIVVNATDSDWEEHTRLMTFLAVEVDQLCPQYARKRR